MVFAKPVITVVAVMSSQDLHLETLSVSNGGQEPTDLCVLNNEQGFNSRMAAIFSPQCHLVLHVTRVWQAGSADMLLAWHVATSA